MSEQLTLGGRTRRRRGPVATQLERTLRALRERDVLAGDAHAFERALLRAAAESVDVAARRVRDEGASPATYARNAATAAAMLQAALGDREAGDDIDALIAALSGSATPAVRD